MQFSGPYVTAVGGTTGVNPETAIFFSSGGFSNYFPRPSYQDKAVTTYIENLNGTYDGLYKCDFCLLSSSELSLNGVLSSYYSDRGRGFPDIAARGDRFGTVKDGKFYHFDGTSASSSVRHP